MEILIIDGQHHRSQYSGSSFTRSPAGFGSFGSPPSRKQDGFNCRSFHSGAGLLPTPFKSKSFSETRIVRGIAGLATAKTPSPSVFSSSGSKNDGKPVRSSAVSIPMAMELDDVGSMNEGDFVGGFCFSELWAGPTYSNSPPPSSLPIPKFSMMPKRTASLDLPRSVSPIELRPIAKSAPASPTGEQRPSPVYFLSDAEPVTETSNQCYMQQESIKSTDFATKALRRILNLDSGDQ